MNKSYVRFSPEQHANQPDRQPASPPPLVRSRRMNRRDAARYLGVSISWLDKSRMTGTGPPYIAIGSRVIYDEAILAEYLAQNTRTSV